MAAVNPLGSETYWFNGLPAEHLAKSTPIDEGIETYWFNGLPGESLFPTVAAPQAAATSAPYHTLAFMGV